MLPWPQAATAATDGRQGVVAPDHRTTPCQPSDSHRCSAAPWHPRGATAPHPVCRHRVRLSMPRCLQPPRSRHGRGVGARLESRYCPTIPMPLDGLRFQRSLPHSSLTPWLRAGLLARPVVRAGAPRRARFFICSFPPWCRRVAASAQLRAQRPSGPRPSAVGRGAPAPPPSGLHPLVAPRHGGRGYGA